MNNPPLDKTGFVRLDQAGGGPNSMVDVFLSYSSEDLVRARRVERALTVAGYEVFWDQTTPPGADWDTWIREKLSTARTVVVLWSKTSIASANVRHEAIIARDAGKLIPVLIDPLSPTDFPMGLYLVQAAKLDRWDGDPDDIAFQQLISEIAARTGKLSVDAAKPSRVNPKKWVLLGSLLALSVALIFSLTLLPSRRDQECRALQRPDTLRPPDAVASVRYSQALDTCLEFVSARASNDFAIYDISNNFMRDEYDTGFGDGPLHITKRMVFSCTRDGASCAIEDQVRARGGRVYTVPYDDYLDNCEGGPSMATLTPASPYSAARCEALFVDARRRYLGEQNPR